MTLEASLISTGKHSPKSIAITLKIDLTLSRSYRQHCEIEITTMRVIDVAAIALPIVSIDYTND